MSTARPLTEGASGADASKPTTAMVPREVPSSGIATWSQPSAGCSAPPSSDALGSQSSTVLSRTSVAVLPGGLELGGVLVGLGEVEVGQPGLEHQTHHAVVQPRGDQGAVVVHRVGDLGCSGVGHVDRRQLGGGRAAAPVGTPLRQRDHGVAGQQDLGAVRTGGARQVERGEPLDLGTAQVVGDQVAVLDPVQRVPVGLDDVRLVDAGLLHVGAGLAVRGADGGGRLGGHRCAHGVAAGRALGEVVDDVGIAVPPVGADQVQATLDVPRQQVVAGLRKAQVRAGVRRGRGIRPRAPRTAGPGVVGAAVRRAGDEGGAEADHCGERDEGAGDCASDGAAQGHGWTFGS